MCASRLETLAPVPLLYAAAQLEAGADAIVWADHATGDLVRNTMYRDYLLPHHQELVPQVKAPVILHCCGRTLDRVEYFNQAGFACYHFESANAPDLMVEKAAGKMKLTGNVNNPITLYARGRRRHAPKHKPQSTPVWTLLHPNAPSRFRRRSPTYRRSWRPAKTIATNRSPLQ